MLLEPIGASSGCSGTSTQCCCLPPTPLLAAAAGALELPGWSCPHTTNSFGRRHSQTYVQEVQPLPTVRKRKQHPLSKRYGYPIGVWCTQYVRIFSKVFFNQTTFNEKLTNWSTINADRMDAMFQGASRFNQDLVRTSGTKTRFLLSLVTLLQASVVESSHTHPFLSSFAVLTTLSGPLSPNKQVSFRHQQSTTNGSHVPRCYTISRQGTSNVGYVAGSKRAEHVSNGT